MEVRAPHSGERADNPCEGWFAIYKIIFLLGLTFPMPQLALTVLVHYQITLGQLMSNSWRAILDVQGLVDQEDLTVGDEDFRAFYFLKHNSNSKGWFAFVKRSRNTLKNEETTNSDCHWKNRYTMGRRLVDPKGCPWTTPLV